MLAPPIWFRPLSKFVLEVSPLVSAVLIGGYLVSGFHWTSTSAETLATLPPPDSVVSSGEELTAMINAAHAAVAQRPATRQSKAASEAAMESAAVKEPEPQQHAAASVTPTPTPKSARRSRGVTASAAVENNATLPPPVAVAPAPQAASAGNADPTWYGRTWGTVAGWGEKAVKVTRLDYAAGVVVETPGAVVRAGKKTVGAVADLIIPDSRR